MIIGVNQRTAPVSVRERFWISKERRVEALTQLSGADGIDAVAVLATCNRTDFILGTRDASAASGSVLSFLTREYGLRLCEWKHFHRMLDETALVHLFRVACGLDAAVAGEPDMVAEINSALTLAQQAGTSGRFLEAVLQKAAGVAKAVRTRPEIAALNTSVACAAVELARQIFGSLEKRKVLLLGAGNMSAAAATCLAKHHAGNIRVISRSLENARDFTGKMGGTAVPLEDLLPEVQAADVVISSACCGENVLSREEVAHIAEQRDGAPLLLVDLAVPRDISPGVRGIAGVFLYDVDDLATITRADEGGRKAAISEADKIVAQEAKLFHTKLLAERVVPTIVALRSRLDEICRQELEALREESAGTLDDQEYADLQMLANRITHHIAGALARELKDLPEKLEQERLTAAVQRLFHLEEAKASSVGTRN